MFNIKIFALIILSITTYQRTFAQWCTQDCPTTLRNRAGSLVAPDPCSEQFELVTDFAHENCETGYFYAEKENCVHKCFARCVEDCGTSTICNPIVCPPGYVCPNSNPSETSTCQLDPKASCFAYDDLNPNPWQDAWKPECLIDGTWKAKQCKGESRNGRCFCYDAVGNRIFGQEFEQNAGNMTCACSRKRIELMNSGSRFYTTLHCDTMGNYEPLQCDNGQCWCVEPMTGEITVNVVPERMMTFLPCYSKEDIGDQYMRQCESEEFAQKKILYELNVHGTEHAVFSHIMCDADGTYGTYQISKGIAGCKWKDNSQIESYQTDVSEGLTDINCNCARDKKIYDLAGMIHNLQCQGNGNYRLQQLLPVENRWYCVDSDGFRNSDYSDSWPTCT